MKLATKLVIGSALALTSLQALAQVAVPPPPYNSLSAPTNTAGNGSALFTLFSNADATPFSYDFNLGLHFNDLLPTNGMNTPGLTLTWNLTGLTIPATVPTSSLVWHVTAASNTAGGINTAGAFKLLTTADQSVTAATIGGTGSQVLSIANNNDNNFLRQMAAAGGGTENPAGSGNFTGVTNPITTTNTADGTYANGKYSTVLNAFTWNAATGTTQAANFWSLANNRGAASLIQTPVQYAGIWTLNLTAMTLTYSVGGAAVPLPAGLWLLLSGLAGLGIVGRRREEPQVLAA